MKKKKESRQIRISLSAYEAIRKVAYRKHVPMVQVLEELILEKSA